jgi:hypothetical protein
MAGSVLFFETFVLVQSSGIFIYFCAESRHIAKLQTVILFSPE